MAIKNGQHAIHENHYRHLLLMGVLSFASMYVLMYAMVNAGGNVYNNVNQMYMAGLMMRVPRILTRSFPEILTTWR